MQEAYAIIMAGGVGNRFWPFSRKALPKQFLPMIGCGDISLKSMLVVTADRCRGRIRQDHIMVVTHQDYARLVEDELPWLKPNQMIFEPCNRDTAPCIALALAKIMLKAPKAVAVFLPSDHYIQDEKQFMEDLSLAVDIAAEKEKVVTIGVPPTYPATAYGYIACGKPHYFNGHLYYEGNGFLEKPPQAKARQLLKAGDKLWNSGILVGRVDVLWQKIRAHLPQITGLLDAYHYGSAKLEEIYEQMPKISIDYGVLEKMPPQQMAVLPAGFAWDDIGSFQALAQYWQQDSHGNAVAKGAQVVALDSKGCIVSREGGLVALLGVENLLIAEYDGVLLVADKGQDQKIKELVAQIERQALTEYL